MAKITIEEAVYRNIEALMQKESIIQKLGIKLNILITAVEGKIIYPYVDAAIISTDIIENSLIDSKTEIARRNFHILNNDLKTVVEIHIPYGSIGANSILTIYVIFSLSLFLFFIRIVLKKLKNMKLKRENCLMNL